MKPFDPYDPEPFRTAEERQAEAEKNGAAAIAPVPSPAPKVVVKGRRTETPPDSSGSTKEN